MKYLLLILPFLSFSQTDAVPFGFPFPEGGVTIMPHYIYIENDSVKLWQENLLTSDSLARYETLPIMLAIDAYILKNAFNKREAYLVSVETPLWHFRVFFFKELKKWHSWTFSVPLSNIEPLDAKSMLLQAKTVNEIEEIIGFEIGNCIDGFDEIDLQIDETFILNGFETKEYY